MPESEITQIEAKLIEALHTDEPAEDTHEIFAASLSRLRMLFDEGDKPQQKRVRDIAWLLRARLVLAAQTMHHARATLERLLTKLQELFPEADEQSEDVTQEIDNDMFEFFQSIGAEIAEKLRDDYGEFSSISAEQLEQQIVPIIQRQLTDIEKHAGVEFGDAIKREAVHFVLRHLYTLGCLNEAQRIQAQVFEHRQNAEMLDRIRDRK